MSDAYTLFQVLDIPRVTEKATMCQGDANQMIFRVATWANKPQIKAAVEKLFNVQVLAVQTMNVMGKSKRVGRFQGQRNSWKKAIVRLAEGQTIDFYAKS
ncbi:MAG: 50S ribosomal protein L23 [Magnetococcales bacterium]|nr:50S ribosomal protein L23 [Magnetococcales bacterium]